MDKWRCEVCGKVAFRTEDLALKRALEIWERNKNGPYHRYYKPKCGAWHLTHDAAWAAGNRKNFSRFGRMQLRDYQEYSVSALFQYFEKHRGNPVVALPTGTGKSVVIGEFIRRAIEWYPSTRIMMLTHVKELIEQNMKNLLTLWPTAPAGVYSAGLKRRDHLQPIIFAGIQSVYSKPNIFGKVDILLIDECHLVSHKDDTIYRGFINDLKMANPYLKVIGFSATPWRLKHGMLTDPGGLFTDIPVDLTSRESFNWLIKQGWISPLIPKRTREQIDVSGVKIHGGEFVASELQEAVDKEAITRSAIEEAIRLAPDRDHWLVFATGIEHAEHVASLLNFEYGVPAAVVHSKLSNADRDKHIRDFKSGKLRAVVNNNVLTTGFDFPGIDCIVMLRPTASPGLWVQMLGRGTRPAPDKDNCLVLDFAGNTVRLGPINDPVIPKQKGRGAPGIAPVRLCDACGCYSHASARVCEHCGAEFPQTVKINPVASIHELIAENAIPRVTCPVDRVIYSVFDKGDRPPAMRVDYWSGFRRYSEFVGVESPGYQGRIARAWWLSRYVYGVPPSTADGMKVVDYLKVPNAIVVDMVKPYPKIVNYVFADPE